MTKDSTARDLPFSTPMDIRLDITKLADVAFPLRWGIIGAGSISGQWVRCLHECEGATITAVAARSADRAKEFATKYGITSTYGSYAEMVASPNVDIVYVGTITKLHKEHSLLAIEAGKHVLCEARMAMDADEAHAMLDVSHANPGLVAQIVPAPHTLKVDGKIKDLIRDGYLGDILAVDMSVDQGGFIDYAAPYHWRHSRDMRG